MSARRKRNLVKRQWIDVTCSVCHVHVNATSLTFDPTVKQTVLNNEKTLKLSENDTPFCHVSAFHCGVKMLFFRFLAFQQTALSVQVIVLML